MEHPGAALIRDCVLSKLSRGAIRIGKQVCCLCMYVCVYVCMYVCLCVDVCMHICKYVFMYACM